MQEMTSLASLASEINAQANLAEACANQAVVHAARCGAALNAAKGQIPHGGWLAWLEGNCPRVKERQARNYMRVATQYPELIDSNRHSNAVLPSIYSAIALLSAPEETQDEIKDELEGGKTFTEKELLERIKAAKDEEIARLNGEKALANRRLDEWRSQAVSEKKAREDAEASAKLRANELAKLKNSIEKSANDLAAIRTGELRAELDLAKIDKAELEQKLKAAKKEREDAISRGVTNRLREQQEQVTRLENQLQALEHHRTALQRQIEPMEQSAASAAHHDKHVKALDHLLNQASLEIIDAFDPDFCAGLPAHYTEIWGKGLDKLRQLTAMLEQQLDAVNVMRLERAL